MTLDQYLEQFIEGYLFEDLRAMATINLAADKRYGGVGYPMVMAALSGIEVLGVLTSRAKFNQDNGAARFGEFWRNYVYLDRPAFQRLDSLVYEFIRHRLAHSFMTKPIVVVTKHRDVGHLHRRAGDVLYLDALTLMDDLETAYFHRLKRNITAELKANMEARFVEFREAYWQDHATKKDRLAKAPSFAIVTEVRNEATRVNSPSIHVSYSTRVSICDDPNG